MATTTSAPSKVGTNFYKTSVTTNADGSLKATTFRTDSTGGGATAVSTVNTTADGTSTRSFESGATTAEKAAFSNPQSPERQAYSQQVQSQNPYGSNPTATQKQNIAKAAGGSGNTASGTNVGAASTSPQFSQEQAIAAIESLDVRTSYRQDLSYPLNRNQKQDYIKFEMLEYSPRSFSGTNLKAFESGVDAGLGQKVFGDERLGGKDRKTLGAVSLPISSPISDTNSVGWGDDTISGLSALGQGAFMNLVGGTTTQSTDDKKTPPSESGSGATKALLVSELSKAAVGGAGGNLLTRATGAVINPNIELLFNGPSLRTFSFTFPLSARSEAESKTIQQIIRFFKQGMSVKRSTSALFLKSPHTFRIKYIYAGSNKDHPWINLIKECALTNCSVNYTPAGNYATYGNGAMTMYEITLNFSELEPIFDDDYKSLDGNSAGKDTMVGY